jgi:hypothetical protein
MKDPAGKEGAGQTEVNGGTEIDCISMTQRKYDPRKMRFRK